MNVSYLYSPKTPTFYRGRGTLSNWLLSFCKCSIKSFKSFKFYPVKCNAHIKENACLGMYWILDNHIDFFIICDMVIQVTAVNAIHNTYVMNAILKLHDMIYFIQIPPNTWITQGYKMHQYHWHILHHTTLEQPYRNPPWSAIHSRDATKSRNLRSVTNGFHHI